MDVTKLCRLDVWQQYEGVLSAGDASILTQLYVRRASRC